MGLGGQIEFFYIQINLSRNYLIKVTKVYCDCVKEVESYSWSSWIQFSSKYLKFGSKMPYKSSGTDIIFIHLSANKDERRYRAVFSIILCLLPFVSVPIPSIVFASSLSNYKF